MCDIFDDWDAEDFAFWGGFIQTQLEAWERDEEGPEEPSPADLLEYYDPITGRQVKDEDE